MKVYLVTTERPGDYYPILELHSVWATSELAEIEAAWVRESDKDVKFVDVEEWEVEATPRRTQHVSKE